MRFRPFSIHLFFTDLLSNIGRALLPEQCRMCLLTLTKRSAATSALCERCYLSLPGLRNQRCTQCAEPWVPEHRQSTGAGLSHDLVPNSATLAPNLPSTTRFVCATCRYWHPAFDATVACCDYAAPVNQWILQLKYHNDIGTAKTLAQLIAFTWQNTDGSPPIDLIIPAPISRHRLITRGYNQAAVMACAVANQTQSRLILGLINKPMETAQQATLHAEHRADNLKNAFSVNKSHAQFASVAGKHVAIVDDVMTTGATLEALADLLKKECGAARVTCLVFARTPPP